MLRRKSKSITPSEAFAAMSSGQLQIVDVRKCSELAEASVDGATHIELSEIRGRLGELDRGRPVAFLCRSGRRSAMATHAAAQGGLDAANISGGVLAWTKAGLPLTSAPTKDLR